MSYCLSAPNSPFTAHSENIDMDPFDVFPLPASIMLTAVSSKHGETLQGEGDARPHLVVLFSGIRHHRRCLRCSTPPPPPPPRSCFGAQLLPCRSFVSAGRQQHTGLAQPLPSGQPLQCQAPAVRATLPAASCSGTAGFSSSQFLLCMAASSAPHLAASPSISGNFTVNAFREIRPPEQLSLHPRELIYDDV